MSTLGERQLSQHRWFLPVLLCSQRSSQSGESYPLDRIRIQKGIFLLTQRGPSSWQELYNYRPYNWGPYSRDLSDDLKHLIASDVLSLTYGGSTPYGRYRLTVAGEEVGEILWNRIQPTEDAFIKSVRSYVTNRDFNSLLREVYGAYPDFATKSVWAGRK